MAKMYSCGEADIIANEGLANIRRQEPQITEKRVSDFYIHLDRAARYCAAIAGKVPFMDAKKAYVFGKLHDYGKFFGDLNDKTSFHGWTGYCKMMEAGQPEIARVCLTHTFFEEDFNLEEYIYWRPDLEQCHNVLKNIKFDDYDRLAQLVDLLAGGVTSGNNLECRLQRIKQRYNLPDGFINRLLQNTNATKAYFDNLCGCDIITLFGDDYES